MELRTQPLRLPFALRGPGHQFGGMLDDLRLERDGDGLALSASVLEVGHLPDGAAQPLRVASGRVCLPFDAAALNQAPSAPPPLFPSLVDLSVGAPAPPMPEACAQTPEKIGLADPSKLLAAWLAHSWAGAPELQAWLLAQLQPREPLACAGAAIDLGPWDLMSVMSLTRVNQDLRSANVLPRSLQIDAGPEFQLQANISHWQISPGGSGTLVRLAMHLDGGTARATGLAGQLEQPLAGVVITFETSLALLRPPSGAPQQELRLAITDLPDDAVRDAQRHLRVVQIDSLPGQELLSELLKLQLPVALFAVRSQFYYAFATAALTRPDEASFLTATDWRCATATFDDGSAWVALMGVQGDRAISAESVRIDPALVPPTAAGPDAAALAFCKPLLMRHVIAPLVRKFFASMPPWEGDPADGLRVSQPFQLPDVDAPMGPYHPRVTQLHADIGEGALHMHIEGDCDLGLNIRLRFSVRTRHALVFDESQQRYGFAADPEPVVSSDADIPWYDWLLLALGIPGTVIAGIKLQVLVNLAQALNQGGLHLSVSELALQPVRWAGVREMHVTQLQLTNGLALSGRLLST